jgi:hypothetical protein
MPSVTTGGRRTSGARDLLRALPWIGPSLLLIAGIVFYPAILMIVNSTREISQTGVDRGSAGLDNYKALFDMPALPGVLLRTVLWVSVVVIVTIVLSLALANLLNKAFPGRQFVRLAVIVPWAGVGGDDDHRHLLRTRTGLRHRAAVPARRRPHRLTGLRLHQVDAVGVPGRHRDRDLRVVALHHLHDPGGHAVDQPGAAGGGSDRRGLTTRDLLQDRAAASATGARRGHDHQHHQRLQQLPHPQRRHRSAAGIRRRHHDHADVQSAPGHA